MHQGSINKPTNNHRPTCAGLMTMAERELAAFFSAVTELFGSEQARLSAAEWLDELVLMDSLPESTRRDWRQITVAASARLASRVNASSQSIKSFMPAKLNCYSEKSKNDGHVSFTEIIEAA